MNGRVNRYYQHPASSDFVRYMIEDSGLCKLDQRIAWNLRNFSGDTALHAQAVGLPERDFNRRVANIGVHMVDELIRLAQIGYEAEKQLKSN